VKKSKDRQIGVLFSGVAQSDGKRKCLHATKCGAQSAGIDETTFQYLNRRAESHFHGNV
jgi:hypothetical protein